jgi:hypothetical protein
MNTRIFNDKWSSELKSQIAKMTDAEYEAFLKGFGSDADQNTNSKTQGEVKAIDNEIINWAKNNK